jgi:hypothetical protein
MLVFYKLPRLLVGDWDSLKSYSVTFIVALCINEALIVLPTQLFFQGEIAKV